MLYQSFYAQDGILRENNPSFKISPFLTSKEALTVLYVVKHADWQRLKHERSVEGNTRCSRVFLSTSWVVQQNRAQPRLLYLFYEYKESVKFPTHSFLIFKTIFFFKAKECRQHMFYTLVKHAFATNQSARYIWTLL